MKGQNNWAVWRRLRQVVQVLFFLLFIVLMFSTTSRKIAFLPGDFFFRIDPLSALTAMLSGRVWIPRLGWALIIVGLTIVIGRVWCGWICPFGTLLEWVSFRKANTQRKIISSRWQVIKYSLFIIILGGALFGTLTFLILDPLALFTRSMTIVIIPGLNYLITAVENFLYNFTFLRPGIDWLEGIIRGPVLSIRQPEYSFQIVFALIFFGILALNAMADRFWCRYLCPLGGFLGLLSKISIFHPTINPGCTGCARCVKKCKLDAIKINPTPTDPSDKVTIIPSECTVCLDCLAECNSNGAGISSWKTSKPPHEVDLSRRQLLKSIAFGVAGIILLRFSLHTHVENPRLLLPPGVADREKFLSKCIRCSECIKVCPTTGLQPVDWKADTEGLWTPILIPRIGHCDYGCNACGQICPSGAIPALTLTEKRQATIGIAMVDQGRCLPWSRGIPCIVCEEMCPTPQKSIHLEEINTIGINGEVVTLQRPKVIRELCIGCGICENHCPLQGDAAIQVYKTKSI